MIAFMLHARTHAAHRTRFGVAIRMIQNASTVLASKGQLLNVYPKIEHYCILNITQF